jgi:O-methyltransferase involved in polyketide biosynthesis
MRKGRGLKDRSFLWKTGKVTKRIYGSKSMIRITGITETLLIPLWARAEETNNSKPIIQDKKAVSIVSQIEYDFSKFRAARLSQLGVSIRTMLFDKAVMDYLENHPDSIVINIGSGLDTRYERLGIPFTHWYELDLPEAINLRRSFFNESDYYHFIAKNMFDDSWMDEMEDLNRPVLLIAEGLFMYFEEKELKKLMCKLVERFPGAEMLVEVMGPALIGKSQKHDSVSKIEDTPEFKWGIKDSRDFALWHKDIEFKEDWCYFDYHKERAGWMGYIIRLPFIRSRIAPRIVHLKFANNKKHESPSDCQCEGECCGCCCGRRKL